MRYKTIVREDGSTIVTDEWNGHSRLHYYKEHQRHSEFYAVCYDREAAERILKKLRRHFKLNYTWEFSTRSWGWAWTTNWRSVIRLPKKGCSLGMICHEVAHVLTHKKHGFNNHHNRRFQRQSDVVCNWARRYLPKPLASDIQPSSSLCLGASEGGTPDQPPKTYTS